MNHRLTCLILVASIVISAPTAQAYDITSDSIYKHISVLADDSLEGRHVGDEGAWKAAQYIKGIFQECGLVPHGDDDSYFQAVEFIRKIKFGDKNKLTVNGVELELYEDFQPMRQSVTAVFDFDDVVEVDYGIKTDSIDGSYNDYSDIDVNGKAVLIKRFAPSSDDNPHVDFDKYSSLTSKINTALKQGATGIIFVTPEDHDDTINVAGPVRVTPKEIPILFLRHAALEKLGIPINNPVISSSMGETELIKVRDTAYNVVGYLPAGNDSSIILGAHYDHLGWGGPRTASTYRGSDRQIHNGADDNGSGTALLIEMARYWSARKELLRHSIAFVAFDGEEFGLIGSGGYAHNMSVDSTKVRMMVNMDMIGRIREQDNGLAIMGTGTCDEFQTYFDELSHDEIKLSLKESGTGPSDHIAFYNRKIPVLFFFTGAHKDYHKPTDDIDLVDTDGIVKVGDVVTNVVAHFDQLDSPMKFKKTKDENEGKRRSSFSVTFGIMPDYIAEVKGLKVDGVIPDRPGERAGIIDGDIIIKIGDLDIGDIYDYMNSLSKFRKGDTTNVVVERAGEEVQLQIIFE